MEWTLTLTCSLEAEVGTYISHRYIRCETKSSSNIILCRNSMRCGHSAQPKKTSMTNMTDVTGHPEQPSSRLLVYPRINVPVQRKHASMNPINHCLLFIIRVRRLRRPLRTVQPLNMPQSPPNFSLLQLRTCHLLLLLGLEFHLSTAICLIS